MAESTEAAPIPTVRITLRLPILNPGDAGGVVSNVQHMLNDFDRWAGVELLLNETGEFGPKTKERVAQFQEDNDILPATGIVATRTWTALLQKWLPVDEASSAG